MPNQPGLSDVHVNAPLTNLSVAEVQDSRNFMHDRVFANVPVQDKVGTFLSHDTDDFLRDEAKTRRPGALAALSGFDVTASNTYSCVRYDIGKLIPDEIRKNASAPLDLDEATMKWALQKVRMRMERIFSTNFMASSVWDNDVTPGTLWDVATSDPFTDMDTGRVTVLKGCGMEPNVLAVGYDVHQALKKHPLVIERVKYVAGNSHNLAVSPMSEAEAILAAAFELEDYVVSRAIYSSTEEGAATPTHALAATETDAILVYRTPSPSLMTPSAGYVLSEQPFASNSEGVRVKKYRDEPRESDVIEVAFSKDFKVFQSAAGYRFGAAVS